MNPVAMITANAAATPALPTAKKGAGCAILTHSGVGLYEVTLDQPIAAAECVATLGLYGGVVDADGHIEHTSDTVKTIHTNVAGAADDTVDFCATFWRVPAGH